MDSLVAQYTRPAFADEGQSQEEQQELLHDTPELSLKFALPPVAQVYILYHIIHMQSFSGLGC
jgi:20S proteasome subunit beta 5